MRRVPNVTCTTNPCRCVRSHQQTIAARGTDRLRCRIRYYTQDIVVFRDNLHQKMQRHALLPALTDPDDDDEVIDVDAQPAQVDISKHVRPAAG